MCRTAVLKVRAPEEGMKKVRMSKTANTNTPVLGRKRARRDSGGTPSVSNKDISKSPNAVPQRPHKRVSFCNRDTVLGRAQAYDRTSSPDPIPIVTRMAQTASKTAGSAPRATANNTHNGATQKANFCGIWRRSHGFNWAALLELSGVDKAAVPEQAAKMRASSVVHLIDHDEVSFRLIVHSDSGNTQDQHFFIGGQPRPSTSATAASSTTLANMRWTKNGQALVLTSVDPATGDEMTVSRHLASQGSVMVQHYRARRARTGETAEAVTIFRRMVRRREQPQS